MIKSLHTKFLFFLTIFAVFAISATGQISTNEYYQNASGKTGGELKTALHFIIRNHTELPYTSNEYDVWDALKETDEDPSNTDNVILIYTNRSEVKTHQDDGSGDNNSWNREHIWAKSHGGFGTDPGAGTDIHHLRACDRSVNTDRSNLFYDNGGEAHDEATECNYDEDSWEPRDAVKGDIARMILYMAVCYEGEDGDPDLEMTDDMSYSKDNYTAPFFGKLSTLLSWNESDPVDDTEKARNEKVYTIQGNRNPFIDHPEWVNTIWVETDSDSPIANNFSPENGSDGILLTANLSIHFTEEVLEGSGNVIIKRDRDDSTFETLDVTDTRVTITNNSVLIDPEAKFEEGTKYYVIIENGAFTDASSNTYEGISDKNTWNFTATYIPPAIVTLSPEKNSENISTDTDLEITFDKEIHTGSGFITIKKDNDDSTFESLDVTGNRVTVTNNSVLINPDSGFETGTKYYVLIDNGAFTNTSSDATAFEGISEKTTWSFTTLTPPNIVEFSPEDDSENIPADTDLEITFDKDVQAGDGYIRIFNGSTEIKVPASDASVTYNGTQVSIDLPNDLETGTEYYINIDNDAFASAYGAYFEGISSETAWSFTTEIPTGIDDVYTEEAPSFYPNPARSEIYLVNMNDIESLYITNLTGRNVLEITSPGTRISLTNLPKGMYFVTFISSDGSRITKKLLKQ